MSTANNSSNNLRAVNLSSIGGTRYRSNPNSSQVSDHKQAATFHQASMPPTQQPKLFRQNPAGKKRAGLFPAAVEPVRRQAPSGNSAAPRQVFGVLDSQKVSNRKCPLVLTNAQITKSIWQRTGLKASPA